ncbi:hypothetical protein JYT87_02825 [Nitrospira defluvii]|nr:hypothetical protein [Nitrospira defluvii]
MNINTMVEEFIKIMGGIFSFGAIAYAILSIFYLFNLWFMVLFLFGLPIFIFCSFMAFGLWNLKKWGRYFAIISCFGMIVDTFDDGMSAFGSLDRFRVFHIVLILIFTALCIFFMLPAVKQVMKN